MLVTTFASNVARLRAVAEAAQAAGRSVVVAGRAMERVVQVARECGFLDGLPPFLSLDMFAALPRDKIVVLATGSQGEPRAAMARVAENEHPAIKLAAGDLVIFSSRAIPGNDARGQPHRQQAVRSGHGGDHRQRSSRALLRPSAARRGGAAV